MALTQNEMDIKPAGRPGIPVGRRAIKFSHLHGRVVSGLKLVLPTIAIALVLAVIAWPMLEEQGTRLISLTKAEKEFAENIQISDPTYSSIGGKDSPFTLTATRAVQDDPDKPVITLFEPKGDVFWADNDWYAITAPNGELNQETGTLELFGGVNAFQDKGYEFRTESMIIDMKGRNGYGLEPIVGQGPDLYLSGEGFRVYNMGKRVEIIGKSKLIIRTAKSGT